MMKKALLLLLVFALLLGMLCACKKDDLPTGDDPAADDPPVNDPSAGENPPAGDDSLPDNPSSDPAAPDLAW